MAPEVLVYKEFDQDNPYLTSGTTIFWTKIMTKRKKLKCNHSRNDIDKLKEEQYMWLLHPSGALENKLNRKIPIHSDYALSPKKWLTESNWALYLQQLIEKMENWKKIMNHLIQNQPEHFNCLKKNHQI